MIQPLWRTVWRLLVKLKTELPYDPAIPLLGIYLEKTIIQKESCTTRFIAVLFTVDLRTRGGERVSWDEVREWHRHIYYQM